MYDIYTYHNTCYHLLATHAKVDSTWQSDILQNQNMYDALMSVRFKYNFQFIHNRTNKQDIPLWAK